MDKYRIFTIADRPELQKAADKMVATVWPTFRQNGNVAVQFWHRLFNEFADFQYVVCRENSVPVGLANAIPLVWDSTIDGLPENGWDGVMLQGFQDIKRGLPPNTLAVLAVTVALEFQGQGVSSFILQLLQEVANDYHLPNGLIVPVRPSMKSRYPLIAIEDYVQWSNSDGLPFDPRLRTHVRLGGEMLTVADHSMLVTGSVREWEHWANMYFPQSAEYVVPSALVPVSINCEIDQGRYIEPNIWIHHRARGDLE